MKFEKRRLLDLKAAAYNPRKELTPDDAEYQKIKNSILQFGYVDPIIINSDGTIIGGHQRRNVLMDLGYDEVDVVVLDVDQNNEKALNIALNKITGEWDEEKLRDLLVDLDIQEFDISYTGFEQNELEQLVENLAMPEEANDDDFDAEEMYEEIQEPIVKNGEIWLLGRHRLMCGDSTSMEDMKMLMGGEKADLVITDPPYNVDYGKKTEFLAENGLGVNNGKIMNDNMDSDSFYQFLFDFYQTTIEVMQPGAAIYVFHADTEGINFRKAFKDAGLKLSQCLIWEKNALVLGRNDYQWRHEPCLYGWKEGAAHYFINDRTQTSVILEDELDFESMKKADLISYIEEITKRYADQTTVIYDQKPVRNNLHPTMKPVSLIGKFMSNSSKPEWNVLDAFGGSGTTLMAAEQLNRTAFLMELDEKFCDVIIKRWEDYTGEKAIRVYATEQSEV